MDADLIRGAQWVDGDAGTLTGDECFITTLLQNAKPGLSSQDTSTDFSSKLHTSRMVVGLAKKKHFILTFIKTSV